MSLSPLEKVIDFSRFVGRNGGIAATRLRNENGFTGECVEMQNCIADNAILENKPGEQTSGDEISATGTIASVGKWGTNLVTVQDTDLYIKEGDSYNTIKTGLTADLKASFLEYNSELYVSNGTDTHLRCNREELGTNITGSSTTIDVGDATEYDDDVSTVYIEGDEIDYVGVSKAPIISKVFADSPYTATTTETTINVDTSGGNVIINLFTAVANTGEQLIIRKTTSDANTVTINGNAAETIDGAASVTLSAQGDSSVIEASDSVWFTVPLTSIHVDTLDNVTNIDSSHTAGVYVVQTKDLSDAPLALALAEYGEKYWNGKVTDEDYTLYYSSTALVDRQENFYEFAEAIQRKKTIYETYTINGLDSVANNVTIEVDGRNGAFTATLPTAAGITGTKFKIVRVDSTSNNVTIDGNGAETIDGFATVVLLGEGATIIIQSDGTNFVSSEDTITSAGAEYFAHNGAITAIKNYRENLLVSFERGMKIITGFTDDETPIPIKQDLFKSNGAINEDCLVEMEGDMVYLSSDKRVRRLFTTEGDGNNIQLKEFDTQIQDVLEELDDDQSEASMVYSPKLKVLFIACKTDGSSVNDIRIRYSTKTNGWSIDRNYYCKNFVEIEGDVYYGSSIDGSVYKYNEGLAGLGGDDILYESPHYKDWIRKLLTHHYFDGEISEDTELTVEFYVGGQLVKTIIIDSNDILQSSIDSEEAIGDNVYGDVEWGGSNPEGKDISLTKRFEKKISLGFKGKKYYYKIKTNKETQLFKIETSIALAKDTAVMRQSTS